MLPKVAASIFGASQPRLCLNGRQTIQALLNNQTLRWHSGDQERKVTTREEKKAPPPPTTRADPSVLDVLRKPEHVFESGLPIPHQSLKRFRVEEHLVDMSQFTDDTRWFPCYKFKMLQYSRTVIRFKLYLTGLSTYVIGDGIWQYLTNPAATDLMTPVILSGLTLTGLIIAGNFFRKLIVQIYICDDNEHVRLSRFTAFGRRLDLIVPREAIWPLAETNTSFRSALLKVKFKKPDQIDLKKETVEFWEDQLYLSLVFGNVVNVSKMERAMGKISLGLATG